MNGGTSYGERRLFGKNRLYWVAFLQGTWPPIALRLEMVCAPWSLSTSLQGDRHRRKAQGQWPLTIIKVK
jgi:hypothetical protein